MINTSFDLRQLQEIDLSRNGFMRLQLCTFTGLLHLRRVDLRGNRLRSLPTALFADNGELEYLDLSHNLLGEGDGLPDLLLHSIPLLKVLNVSANQATRLKLGLRFQVVNQLHLIDLSHNNFFNASQDAFEMAENWDPHVSRSLDLSYCGLQYIHPQALTKVPGLRSLNLAGNGLNFSMVVDVLKELETSGLETVNLSNMNISDPQLFAQVTLMALRQLDLSRNLIESVPASTFGNIRSLLRLDLSHNLMTSLHDGFVDLVNLRELNMSHCRLTTFQGSAVGRMQELTSLDLSHNRLLDATEVDLSALRNLHTLDLSHNTLQAAVLPGDNSHLQRLDYASNALTTLPAMANMRSLRFFDAHDNNLQSLSEFLFTEVTHIEVANFSNNDLTAIDHRAFLPTSPQVIDLSHNFLTRTQFFSWTTTKQVYLHDNRLSDVDQQTFYGMDRLQVLDLRNNNISILHDETFRFLSNLSQLLLANNSLHMTSFYNLFRSMESLKTLDLGYNGLQNINTTSFQPLINLTSLTLKKNKMKVIPVELFKHLDKLTQVDFSGNPFDCSCELLPFRDWLRSTKVEVVQRFDLNLTNMCMTPYEYRGLLVTMYEVGEFQCNTKMLYMIIFGSIGGLGILVGIISSLVCHYYSKWRKKHNKERQQQRGHSRHGPHKQEDDNSSKKEKNTNRVDMVRVSKRSDPYGKQELVNGWVNSKKLTVHHKNLDLPSSKSKKHLQDPPPRPPWPERLSGRSASKSKQDSRERRRDKWRERPDQPAAMRWESGDREDERRRMQVASEMIPMINVRGPPHARPERSQSMVPLWDARQYDRYPPFAARRPGTAPNRWESVDVYPGWASQRPVYSREDGRCYTLPNPYPGQWARNPPYGPQYPYRGKRYETDDPYRNRKFDVEEEKWRMRQVRQLPYPPTQVDAVRGDPTVTSGYRDHRYPEESQVPDRRHSEYENIQTFQDERRPASRDNVIYRTIGVINKRYTDDRDEGRMRNRDGDERQRERDGEAFRDDRVKFVVDLGYENEDRTRPERRYGEGQDRYSREGGNDRGYDTGASKQNDDYNREENRYKEGRFTAEGRRKEEEDLRRYRQEEGRIRDGKRYMEEASDRQVDRGYNDDVQVMQDPREPRPTDLHEPGPADPREPRQKPHDPERIDGDKEKSSNNGKKAENQISKPKQGNTTDKSGPASSTTAVNGKREKNGLRRGTSEGQIHRRDSEYRNAMQNPVLPKVSSTPSLAEVKTSQWL